MKNKTFIEILTKSINNKKFKEGEDFIKIDTEKYLVLLPFNFEILHDFSMFGKYNILGHCVTCEEKYFKEYYNNEFLKKDRIKCFFFDKSIKIGDIPVRKTSSGITLWEFTCWLDKTDKHIHLFHDYYNQFDYCETDRNIYEAASKIINTLRKTIFHKLDGYDLNEIKKLYIKKYGNIV